MKALAGTKLRHVAQGRNQCGQACIAELTGAPLSLVVTLVGHRGCTRVRDLAAGLWLGSDGRLAFAPQLIGAPPLNRPGAWLVAVHLALRSRRWHWAVLRVGMSRIEIVWPTEDANAAAATWVAAWKITRSHGVVTPLSLGVSTSAARVPSSPERRRS